MSQAAGSLTRSAVDRVGALTGSVQKSWSPLTESGQNGSRLDRVGLKIPVGVLTGVQKSGSALTGSVQNGLGLDRVGLKIRVGLRSSQR